MKKRMKTRIIAIAAAMSLIAGMTGCGSNTSQNSTNAGGEAAASDTKGAGEANSGSSTAGGDGTVIEISLWHPMGGVNGETVERIANGFNETVGKEKGIRVSTVYQGANADLAKKLKAAFQANDFKNMPDLTFCPAGETGYMQGIDVVVKAQEVLDQNLIGLGIDDFEPAAIKALTCENRVVGLPYAPSTICMYYNKDAFKEAGLDPEAPPKTIKELGEYSAKLTKRDGDTITQYGFGVLLDSWPLSSWIGQQDMDGKGYSLFGDNDNGHSASMTKVEFDTNNTMKTFLTEYQAACQAGSFKYLEDDRKNNFGAGNITITLASSADIFGMNELAAGKFEVGVAYLPKVNDSSLGGVSCGGSALYPIDKGDADKLAAVYEYLKYLYSPEIQMEWHTSTGYLAAIPATYELEEYKAFLKENPLYAVGANQLHDSNINIQEPMCGVGGAISGFVKDGIVSVLDGTSDIDSAVASMAQACNQALEDYNLANQ